AAAVGAAAYAATAAQPAATTTMPRTQVVTATDGRVDPYGEQPNRTWYVVAGVLALIALVVGALVLINAMRGDDVETFALDDLTGMSIEDARVRLDELDLVIEEHPLTPEEIPEGTPEGQVVSTNPPGGTEVQAGETVAVS